MIHEARIIPIDGRPPMSTRLRQWLGDSRGRWEGDTLVVETTNFTEKTSFRGTTENMKLVERFTRTGPDTIDYRFTVEDPATFTAPWTAMLPMNRLDEKMYRVRLPRRQRRHEESPGRRPRTGKRAEGHTAIGRERTFR